MMRITTAGEVIGVVVVRTELLGRFTQLGSCKVRIEIRDPGRQGRFRCAPVAFSGALLEAVFFSFRLGFFTLGLGGGPCVGISVGIARVEIESGLSQTGKGIAVDTPGGDPAQLFAHCLF
jgi:hypothetical protein